MLTNEDAGSNSAALTISLYLTLDRRTDIGLSLGTANFLRYSRELYDRGNPIEPPFGTCTAIQARNDRPGVDPARPAGLDAGPRVTLASSGTGWALNAQAPGAYFTEFQGRSPFGLTANAAFSNERGGGDLGPFNITLSLQGLEPFAASLPGLREVRQDEPFVARWTK